jgi:hypothetical protein
MSRLNRIRCGEHQIDRSGYILLGRYDAAMKIDPGVSLRINQCRLHNT